MTFPLGYISYDSNTFLLKLSLTITYLGNLQQFHEFFEKEWNIFFALGFHSMYVTPTHNNSTNFQRNSQISFACRDFTSFPISIKTIKLSNYFQFLPKKINKYESLTLNKHDFETWNRDVTLTQTLFGTISPGGSLKTIDILACLIGFVRELYFLF